MQVDQSIPWQSLPFQFDSLKEQEDRMSSSQGGGVRSNTRRVGLDGGYGWVICFVSFVINFMADGISMSFGVFVPEIMQKFNSSSADTVLIGSLNCGTTYILAPLIIAMDDFFGTR